MKMNQNIMENLRPMYQTEGAGGGKDTAVTDLATLPDAKLNELITADEPVVEKTLKGETPSQSSPKGEEGKGGEGVEGVVETPEAKIAREKAEAAAATARATETPEAKIAREAEEAKSKDVKLFAGKYKTKEDLVNGFINAAKALNYNPKLLEKMAALALKTGDVETIEEVYKDLELAIASNEKAKLTADQQPSADKKPGTSSLKEEGRDTSLTPTKMDDAVKQEATQLTLQGALSELRGSRIVQRMERQGINLPDAFMVDEATTKEFLSVLEKEIPWMYDQLENELTNLVHKHAKEVDEVIHSMQEAAVENPKRREGEIAKIKAEAQAIKLPVKDEELTAFVEEALKQPWVYETRNGIQFIRENAIMDAWYLKNRETIKKQIQLNGEITGRTQAVDDLDKNRKKTTSSISNASIPSDQGSRREKAGTLDLTDPRVLDSLSKEEIDALLKDEDKREALRPK
jgi:hypothetical protein